MICYIKTTQWIEIYYGMLSELCIYAITLENSLTVMKPTRVNIATHLLNQVMQTIFLRSKEFA